MIKDPTTDMLDDPEAQLRKRIVSQVQPDPLAPAASPSPTTVTPANTQRVTDPAAPVAPAPAPAASNAAPAPDAPPNTGFTIPTNPDGSQVGAGIPWANQADSHPLYAPAGYHWDPKLAAFQPGQDTNKPTGGKLTDPGFAASYVAWAAQQPGVNPSVKNDPQYWIGRFTSGAFGDDQDYALKRMMQAEGAPEGAGGGGGAGMPPATSAFTDQVRKLLMERMGRDTAPVDENDVYIKQPMDAANLQAARGMQSERTDLAEHLYASGDLGSNSLQQGIQQSAERNAVGLGSLKGKLIQQEYLSRRSDLNDAMQQALASGDRETASQLQMALAQLDAQLRREGYGVDLAKFTQQQNNTTVGAV